MRTLLLALSCALAAHAVHVDLPPPFEDYCILENGTNRYDPKNQEYFKWVDVDLDTPAFQRWQPVVVQYVDEINDLIGVLIDLVTPFFPNARQFVDEHFSPWADLFDQPYQDEIKGIANATGINVGEIVIYNIFYEIFTVCTSIVAQDPNGVLMHARNLDFGLFMGWNPDQHEWKISQALRKMIVNVNWKKDGKTLFKSNNFVGYIGIYNGLKQGAFSITANDRFQKEGGYVGIYRWITGLEPNGKWMSWLTRETLVNANTYAEAKEHLMNTPMLSPVYFILGGINPYEGCIIARSLNGTDILTEMSATDPYGWYVLETNYDKGTEPLYLDDRETPGEHCMHVLGQNNVSFPGIYNVLSSRSNLNKLTVYTVLMRTSTGEFETHPQSCPGDCWPW